MYIYKLRTKCHGKEQIRIEHGNVFLDIWVQFDDEPPPLSSVYPKIKHCTSKSFIFVSIVEIEMKSYVGRVIKMSSTVYT